MDKISKIQTEIPKNQETNQKIEMYLNPETAKLFAEREKNDGKEHSIVCKIIDNIVTESFKNKDIKMANLGAGANPQKYEGILNKIKNGSELDWVDISSGMLEMASKNVDPSEKINFIKNNFMGYLNSKEDRSLDCVIMQYAINYIDNLKDFFQTLSKKLNNEGTFIANLGGKVLENGPEVSFLVNGQEITGQKIMVSGDRYTIRFLNPDGTIFASTEKNYFSDEEIISTTTQCGLSTEIKTISEFRMLIARKN